MTAHAAASPINVQALREDFPALRQEVHGKPLAYLDNAASAQTPEPVVEALVLPLGHSGHPAHPRDTVEDPRQLCVLGHL